MARHGAPRTSRRGLLPRVVTVSVGVHAALTLIVATLITSAPAAVRRPTRIDLTLDPPPTELAEPEAPVEFAFPTPDCDPDEASEIRATDVTPDFSYLFEREETAAREIEFDGPPTEVSGTVIGSGRSSRGRVAAAASPPAPVGAAQHAGPAAAPPVAATPIPAPPPIARPVVRATPLEGNEPPRYPRAARRRGWEGTVVALIHVDSTGGVTEVEIEESSGHAILDDAVRSAIDAWRYRPAQRDGRATADTIRRQVRFVCPRH